MGWESSSSGRRGGVVWMITLIAIAAIWWAPLSVWLTVLMGWLLVTCAYIIVMRIRGAFSIHDSIGALFSIGIVGVATWLVGFSVN